MKGIITSKIKSRLTLLNLEAPEFTKFYKVVMKKFILDDSYLIKFDFYESELQFFDLEKNFQLALPL